MGMWSYTVGLVSCLIMKGQRLQHLHPDSTSPHLFPSSFIRPLLIAALVSSG